jgi:translation initiation factor 3 subunit B
MAPVNPLNLTLDDIEIDEASIIIDDNELKKEFDQIEKKYQTDIETGYQKIVFIHNLPKVDPSKEEKLLSVIQKAIFKKFGTPVAGGLVMPRDDISNKTKGILFAEFPTVEEASAIVKAVDGHPLDKAHTLRAILLSEVDRITQLDDEFVPPTKDEYMQKEDLTSWLLDEKSRDQYLAIIKDELTINWFTPKEVVESRSHWTENFSAQWSTFGHYLATYHKQGVALWGGKEFSKIHRFAHPNVQHCIFSPLENFLITVSNEGVLYGPKDQHYQVFVWDLRTGKLVRGFQIDEEKYTEEIDEIVVNRVIKPVDLFPEMFKWSNDEKYLCRMQKGSGLFVYDVDNSFSLVGKKSYKVDNIKSFEWSPASNMIVFWTPEVQNSPARVSIIDVPSFHIVRTKNLFNVANCKIYWQCGGIYVTVQVDRYTGKTKKVTSSNLAIFRLKEKDVPVEEIEFKEVVDEFQWESEGERFAILNVENSFKSFVSFYQNTVTKASATTSNNFKMIKKLERKGFQAMKWSPKGRFIVLISKADGQIEFWNVNEMELMNTGEMNYLSEVQWDPSGRFVASVTSNNYKSSEKGYCIWDFRGKCLDKNVANQFKEFSWRPRPNTLLSKEDLKKIKKNLKEYSTKFEEEDLKNSKKSSQQVLMKRQKQLDDWTVWLKSRREDYENERENRRNIRGCSSEDEEDYEIVDEWVERVIEENVEEYKE